MLFSLWHSFEMTWCQFFMMIVESGTLGRCACVINVGQDMRFIVRATMGELYTFGQKIRINASLSLDSISANCVDLKIYCTSNWLSQNSEVNTFITFFFSENTGSFKSFTNLRIRKHWKDSILAIFSLKSSAKSIFKWCSSFNCCCIWLNWYIQKSCCRQ